jgi:hypothetical protein
MSAWLSVAVTIVLIVIAYLVLNRNINARTSQQAALDDIKREVGAIITELNATTERNIELIEDRIANLERLIAQADKRLGALRRDLPHPQREPRTYEHLARRVPAGRPAVESDAEPVPATQRTSTEDEQAVPTRERVQRLYMQGVPVERIATIVGKTAGEVELIVSLNEGAEK